MYADTEMQLLWLLNGGLASDKYKYICEFCNFVGELYTYGKNFILCLSNPESSSFYFYMYEM